MYTREKTGDAPGEKEREDEEERERNKPYKKSNPKMWPVWTEKDSSFFGVYSLLLAVV